MEEVATNDLAQSATLWILASGFRWPSEREWPEFAGSSLPAAKGFETSARSAKVGRIKIFDKTTGHRSQNLRSVLGPIFADSPAREAQTERLCGPIYAGHEAIASSGDIDNVTLTAQCTPEHGHVETQAALLNR
jgi:hypothetical protein